MAASAVSQWSTEISRSLRTRRKMRTVFSSEVTNRDFKLMVIRIRSNLREHYDSWLRR